MNILARERFGALYGFSLDKEYNRERDRKRERMRIRGIKATDIRMRTESEWR